MRNYLRVLVAVGALLSVSILFAQSRQNVSVPFNGIVSDMVGTPLRGVRIWVTDSKRFALSDKKGRFGLTNVEATDTLHVKYKKMRYAIPVNGMRSMRLKLADQFVTEEDDELVDIGFGFVKRRECTTSHGTISGEELVRSGRTNLIDALQGKVPGLNIVTGGAPGNRAMVTIRGISSLNLDNTPLFVVDGVVVPSLDFINVYDVDYVEVMKEGSIYGVRGANGVIIVHTKRR